MSKQPAQGSKREQWSGQYGFLLAAIGSAVGLGNIWRFPGVAYTNGGGAFLLPYLFSLVLVGIPVLLFDYAMGHRYRGSAPTVYRRVKRSSEWIGWFQVLVSFVIMSYYAVVIAWAGSYAWFSFKLAWGKDAAGFFFGKYLHIAEAPGISASPVWQVLVPLVAVWGIALFIIGRGVVSGLEKANKVFLPVLVILFGALVVRALYLPGAVQGLTAFFTPNWSALADPNVWMAAFAQIFYSLSIGFGIMLTYASYLKRRSNLGGTGLVAAFANSSFEILAGVGVFAALGFMAHQQGVGVGDLEGIAGVGLSFVTFPTIIAMMPAGALFGVLFFSSLFLAGLTSLVSLIQVVAAALQEKFGLNNVKAAFTAGLPAALLSVTLFATTTGLYSLDIVDKHINEIGIVFIAIVAMVYMSFFARKLPELRMSINVVSSVSIGRWWPVLVGGLIPAVLAYMLSSTLWGLITEAYEGYPWWMLGTLGFGYIAFAFVLTAVFANLPWRNDVDSYKPLDLPGTVPPRPNGKNGPLTAATSKEN